MPAKTRLLSWMFVVFAVSPAAIAQNNRSAVSINGNDANSCTTLQPCRSFAAAIAQTNAGGEIVALDTAGYGPFSIDKSVTVSGAPGVHAAITATGMTGSAIFVQAANTDVVTLRNLVVIGAGAPEGIQIPTGEAQAVHIIDCLVRGLTSGGIVSGAAQTDIDHCIVIDNVSSFAIGVDLVAGKGRVTNSLIASNTIGIEAGDGSNVVVTNSSISGNTTGAETRLFSVSTADLALDRCTLSGNGTAIFGHDAAMGGMTSIRLSNNLISFNGTGVLADSMSTIYSYGNNSLSANTADLGPATTLSMIAPR